MTIIQVLQVVINVEKIYILSSYVLMRLRIFYKYLFYFHNPAGKQERYIISFVLINYNKSLKNVHLFLARSAKKYIYFRMFI